MLPPPPPISTLFPYTTLFRSVRKRRRPRKPLRTSTCCVSATPSSHGPPACRSEEHTSELQSRFDLVCRLLLEKKKDYERQELLTAFRHGRRVWITMQQRFVSG